MRIEIIQGNRVLRSVNHEAQTYVEAPPEGTYKIRLINDSAVRRLAVLSVDGVNVLNGKDAGYDGPGYVLRAWETVDVPGFTRSNSEVAAFTFKSSEASYAAQTGRGTSNVGVIGVAIFDEKVIQRVIPPPVKVVEHHHHYPTWVHPTWTGVLGGPVLDTQFVYCNATNSMDSLEVTATSTNIVLDHAEGLDDDDETPPTKSADAKGKKPLLRRSIKSVGTAYGQKAIFHTQDVTFTRASSNPAEVFALRYATLEQLREWNVPIEAVGLANVSPNPFPMSGAACPAPAGWNG